MWFWARVVSAPFLKIRGPIKLYLFHRRCSRRPMPWFAAFCSIWHRCPHCLAPNNHYPQKPRNRHESPPQGKPQLEATRAPQTLLPNQQQPQIGGIGDLVLNPLNQIDASCKTLRLGKGMKAVCTLSSIFVEVPPVCPNNGVQTAPGPWFRLEPRNCHFLSLVAVDVGATAAVLHDWQVICSDTLYLTTELVGGPCLPASLAAPQPAPKPALVLVYCTEATPCPNIMRCCFRTFWSFCRSLDRGRSDPSSYRHSRDAHIQTIILPYRTV